MMLSNKSKTYTFSIMNSTLLLVWGITSRSQSHLTNLFGSQNVDITLILENITQIHICHIWLFSAVHASPESSSFLFSSNKLTLLATLCSGDPDSFGFLPNTHTYSLSYFKLSNGNSNATELNFTVLILYLISAITSRSLENNQ